MARILVNLTEGRPRTVFTEAHLRRLATLGDLVYFDPQRDDAAAFPGLLAEADAMLTCWGSRRLTPEAWPERTKPLLVAHSAGSVRGIVPKDLLARGVRLTQGAAAIAVAVAQYTVGLAVLALRQATARSAAVREGAQYEGAHPYRDLDGLSVGLVGLSQVGRRVPPLLAPFGCRVLAYDPFAAPEMAAALGVEMVADLDDLIARVDVLSLHAPVTPETENLIDARRIARLKPGSAFLNTARAALVDQDALFARARAGEIQAYLDVTTPEPLPPAHEAWRCPNIFITPHIAGPTTQSFQRMGQHAIDEIERFLNGQPLATEVTFERYDLLA